MKKNRSKTNFILYVFCSAMHLICCGIDIYLAISTSKYIYLLPAVIFAVAFLMNVINAVKYRKSYKSDYSGSGNEQ